MRSRRASLRQDCLAASETESWAQKAVRVVLDSRAARVEAAEEAWDWISEARVALPWVVFERRVWLEASAMRWVRAVIWWHWESGEVVLWWSFANEGEASVRRTGRRVESSFILTEGQYPRLRMLLAWTSW